MKCPHCGQSAPDSNYKCPHCRQVLRDGIVTTDFYKREPKKKKSGSPNTLLLLVVILAAAAIGYFIIQKGKGQPINNPDQLAQAQDELRLSPAASETTEDSGLAPPYESGEESGVEQPAAEGDNGYGNVEQADGQSNDIFDLPSSVSHKPGQEVDLEELLHEDKVTIFDFYSEYCGPCRRISPKLEELDRIRDDIVVVKIDINRKHIRGIDFLSPVARQYNVNYVPYFIIYDAYGERSHEGQPASRYVYRLLSEEGIH